MSLRQRLRDGPTLFGTWVNTPSPDLVETLGDAGFDCVFLDLEHGEYGTEALPDLLRAARAPPAASGSCARPMCRPGRSARPSNAGADGVLAPGVSSAAEAATVVSAAHYPPVGSRGAAPMTRSRRRHGTTPFTSYRERSEAEVVTGAQIEGPAGLAAVDDILATAHLDLAFIGPFDLSQHLGVPGDTSHPAVVEAMGDIVARADAKGVVTGTWAPTAAAARMRGSTPASASSPWPARRALFTTAATELIAELRSLL